MGDAQCYRADGRAPAVGRAPAEGLEDALAGGKEGRCVLSLSLIPVIVDGAVVVVLAYYVAFGPHGPRAPVNPPGTTVKILTGVFALIASAGLLYAGFRSIGMWPFC